MSEKFPFSENEINELAEKVGKGLGDIVNGLVEAYLRDSVALHVFKSLYEKDKETDFDGLSMEAYDAGDEFVAERRKRKAARQRSND